MPPTNLFASVPDVLPEELTEALLDAGSIRIERIVSRGHASPDTFWYDQEEHEWVAVLQGRARLAFADATPDAELHPGDYVFIPAHQRHRVAWTDPAQPTIWLAIFFLPA